MLGALWFGAIAVMALFVMPSIAQTGPAGGQVMNTMLRRGFGGFMSAVGGITVLAGLALYWRFTASFDMTIVHTNAGLAFGIGGAIGIVALIIGGSIVGRGSDTIMRLGGQLTSMPDGPEKLAVMQRLASLRQRVANASRLVLALVAITVILMTLGHRV